MGSANFQVLTVDDLKSGRAALSAGEAGDLAATPEWYVRMATSNPLAQSDDPAVCILWLDAVAAARIRIFAGNCRLGDHSVRCHWGSDFISAPSFRSRGAGVFLIRQVIEFIRARDELFGAFASSDDALRVYRALGSVHVGRAPRYLWPLRSRSILEAHLPRHVSRVATPPVDFGLVLGRAWLRVFFNRARRTYSFERREKFDPEVDMLLDAHNRKWTSWLPADSRVLNWRLTAARSNPQRQVGVDYVRRSDTGELAAYIVTRSVHMERIEGHPYRNFRLLSLMDHLAKNESVQLHKAIVDHLVRQATECDADLVEVVTSDRPLQNVLAAAGLRRVGGHDFSYIAPSGYQGPLPSRIEDWRLTMAAGDGFLF